MSHTLCWIFAFTAKDQNSPRQNPDMKAPFAAELKSATQITLFPGCFAPVAHLQLQSTFPPHITLYIAQEALGDSEFWIAVSQLQGWLR